MIRYIAGRLLLILPVLFGVSIVAFMLIRLIPGNPAVAILGERATPELIARVENQLGLNLPLWRQYVHFLGNAWRGEFGLSFFYGQNATTLTLERIPITLLLICYAALIGLAIAVPFATLAAVRRETVVDHAIRLVFTATIGIPSFWLGIVSLLLVLNLTSAMFGRPWMPPIEYVPIWVDPLRNLSMAFLPAVTVGYRYAAVSMRMTRSAMLEVMQEDYIRTARAKGLINKLIINRHALKNALLPVVTLIGIEFAFLIGGLVVTEQVFNLNGVGRLFVQAVQNQDYTLTQALVMLTVMVFVICNLIVDLLYAWLDPRIRFS